MNKQTRFSSFCPSFPFCYICCRSGPPSGSTHCTLVHPRPSLTLCWESGTGPGEGHGPLWGQSVLRWSFWNGLFEVAAINLFTNCVLNPLSIFLIHFLPLCLSPLPLPFSPSFPLSWSTTCFPFSSSLLHQHLSLLLITEYPELQLEYHEVQTTTSWLTHWVESWI